MRHNLKQKVVAVCTAVLLLQTYQPVVIRPVKAAEPVAVSDATPATQIISNLYGGSDDLKALQPKTVQDVLLGVCRDRGYDEPCAKVLLGMLWKESQNVATAVGDRGLSFGYFQINRYYHPEVSVACAEDLKCSADWTLDYLEGNSYPKYVNYAVQCHNGCNINNGYAASALRHGKRLWDTPLAVMSSQLAKN